MTKTCEHCWPADCGGNCLAPKQEITKAVEPPLILNIPMKGKEAAQQFDGEIVCCNGRVGILTAKGEFSGKMIGITYVGITYVASIIYKRGDEKLFYPVGADEEVMVIRWA